MSDGIPMGLMVGSDCGFKFFYLYSFIFRIFFYLFCRRQGRFFSLLLLAQFLLCHAPIHF